MSDIIPEEEFTFDPWQRLGEIQALAMEPCCLPLICEATIRRCPMEYCRLTRRSTWEKALTQWERGERAKWMPQGLLLANPQSGVRSDG